MKKRKMLLKIGNKKNTAFIEKYNKKMKKINFNEI